MAIENGFLHGDLHPGNLFIDLEGLSGRNGSWKRVSESSEIEIASWGAEHPNMKGFQLQGVFGNNQPTTRATQALLRDHPLASRMIQPHVRKILSNSNRKQYFPGTLLAAPDCLKPFQYL